MQSTRAMFRSRAASPARIEYEPAPPFRAENGPTRSGDRTVTLRERPSLRELGVGRLLTVPATCAIRVGTAALGAWGTSRSAGESARERNHGSAQTDLVRYPCPDLIDAAGNLDEARLREAFAQHGKTFYGAAVTLTELASMLGARGPISLLASPLEGGAAIIEWSALFFFAGHTRAGKHVLERETVKHYYTDRRFFDDVASRIAKVRAVRRRTRLGTARNYVQDWLL